MNDLIKILKAVYFINNLDIYSDKTEYQIVKNELLELIINYLFRDNNEKFKMKSGRII